MFFDNVQTDHYRSTLIVLAQKQRELFSARFNWQERLCHSDITKDINVLRKYEEQYMKCLNEMEALRSKVREMCFSKGITRGIFWWDLPWETVEKYLICDLGKPRENERWRYEYRWEMLREGAMRRSILFLKAHYSDFSSNSYYDYKEKSRYSAEEQADMLHEFNRKIDRSIFLDKMSYSGPVRSEPSGKIYDSIDDYYDSGEFKLDRSFYTNVFKRSLYTVHETDGLQIASRSKDYECAYDIAEFCVTEKGCPERIKLLWFGTHGDMDNLPLELKQQYDDVDVAVEAAANLADADDIEGVPDSVWGTDIESVAPMMDKAIRQSEIYTCLADKLV